MDVKQNRRSPDLTDGRILAGYTVLDRQEVGGPSFFPPLRRTRVIRFRWKLPRRMIAFGTLAAAEERPT